MWVCLLDFGILFKKKKYILKYKKENFRKNKGKGCVVLYGWELGWLYVLVYLGEF